MDEGFSIPHFSSPCYSLGIHNLYKKDLSWSLLWVPSLDVVWMSHCSLGFWMLGSSWFKQTVFVEHLCSPQPDLHGAVFCTSSFGSQTHTHTHTSHSAYIHKHIQIYTCMHTLTMMFCLWLVHRKHTCSHCLKMDINKWLCCKAMFKKKLI